MELLFLLFPLLLIFGVHAFLVRPFLSGELEIPNKYPTIQRTQRILRARNPKARNRELESTLKTLRQDASKSWYDQEKIHKDHLDAKRQKNRAALGRWQQSYLALIPEPTPTFHGVIEEPAKTKWAEAEALYNAKVKAWSGINAPDDPEDSYGVRYIDPNMRVNVRTEPNSQSRLWGVLLPNTTVSLSGWIYGEAISHPDPSNIWFRLNLVGSSEEVYIWSGAVKNKSTSGLTNLNQPETNDYKTHLKAWDGSVVATVEPSHSRTCRCSDCGKLVAPVSTRYELESLQRMVKREFNRISDQEPTRHTVEEMNRLVHVNDSIVNMLLDD